MLCQQTLMKFNILVFFFNQSRLDDNKVLQQSNIDKKSGLAIFSCKNIYYNKI